MNQDKLEVVKQEITRVNIDILGISELKWIGMGELNSGDHYIYYGEKKIPWKKWSSHHSQEKSPKCRTWVQSQKRQNDLFWFGFQGKPFSTTVMQAYAPTTNAEEAEVEWFYDDLQDLLELTRKKKKMSFSL